MFPEDQIVHLHLKGTGREMQASPRRTFVPLRSEFFFFKMGIIIIAIFIKPLDALLKMYLRSRMRNTFVVIYRQLLHLDRNYNKEVLQ